MKAETYSLFPEFSFDIPNFLQSLLRGRLCRAWMERASAAIILLP
jgi:hypothetical protein